MTISLAIIVFVVLFSGSWQEIFAASAPNMISYQGRLLNSNGVPVSDSSASMEFRFFTAISGGTCLWSNSSATCDGNTPGSTTARTVTLTDGLFSEDLGDTGASTPYAAIADSVFGQNTNVYLEVEIAGETLTPRKHIVAAPYALNSQTLDGTDSEGFLSSTGDTASGAYDFSSVNFLGASPFLFEGSSANDFETTFAFTDPTADRTITFQNSSGTVAFTSDIPSVPGGASLWEIGTNGSYEDDAAVIIGADTAFTYANGGVGDMRVADQLEVLDDAFIDNDFIVGASTSVTETLAHTDFSLGGDDVFVAGTAGIEGFVYTDAGLAVSTTTTYLAGAITTTGTTDLALTIGGGDLTFGQNTTIGDGGDTITFDSSDWDISATGNLSNIGTITMDGLLTGTAGATLSGATLSLNTNSNFNTSINTGTSNGLVSIGGGSASILIDSTSWDVTTSGAINITNSSDVIGLTIAPSTPTTTAIDVTNTSIATALAFGTNDLVGTTGNIDLTNFDVIGSSGNITTTGDIAVNGDDITSDGNLSLSGAGYVRVGDSATPAVASGDDDLFVEGDLEVDATVDIASTLNVTGVGTFAANVNANGGFDVDDVFSVADGGVLTTSGVANFDGAADFDSTVDTTGAFFQGGSPLVFEGETSNDFETTFAFTDPTADRTITFQNSSGTVAFLTDITGGSSLFTDGGTVTYLTATSDDLAIGGTTLVSPFSVDVDTNILRVGDGTDDTNDPTITFYASDASDSGSISFVDADNFLFSGGNVSLSGDLTISGDDLFMTTNTTGFILVADGTNYNPVDVSGDIDIASSGAATIQSNSVVLGTDTTGNYVATLADAGGLDFTVTGSGSEGAAVTLDIAADAIDFDEMADAMTLDAATTIAGNTLSLNTNSNNNVNINTGTSTGVLSLGGGSGTIAIDSTVWDVAASGAISITNGADIIGLTIAPTIATATALDLTDTDIATALSVGTNDIVGTTGLINYNNFDVDASGNVSFAGDLTISGDDLFMTTNTTGFILVADGTNYNPVDVSGDIDVASSGAVTIQSNSVALGTDTTGNYVATLADAGSGTLSISGSGSESAAVTIDIADDAIEGTELADAMTLDAATLVFDDGTNTLLTLTDTGTTGNLSLTGDLTISGDDLFMATNTSGFVLVADGTNYNPVAISGDIAITSTGATTIQANSIALGTDTTGNYVATLADAGNGFFTVANSGSESAAVTLDLANDVITFAQISDSSAIDADTTFTAADSIGLLFQPTHTAGDTNFFVIDANQTDDANGTDDFDALRLDLTSESGDAGDTFDGLVINWENGTANTIMDSAIKIDNAETTASTMTDAIIITSSGVDAGVTDAIDVSAANITNAINVGTNIILGTAATIDFSEFDLSSSTGSITIDDGGNAGQISIEGSVLDIDSLIFTAGGTLTSVGATSDLVLSAGRDITFDDDNLSAAIPLSLSDTDLSSFAAGDRAIIDALNYLRANAASLFTDGGTVTYLTATSDDVAIGGTTLASPFSIDVDTNILRLGDAANDANDPTMTFYASDATDSGSFSYIDTDGWFFSGGDIYVGASTEAISLSGFVMNGGETYIDGSLGVNGVFYGDSAIDITGSLSADIAMLSAGATVASELMGRFSHSFSGALSADKQEIGIYTELNASTTATSQNYDLVGTYTEVTWGVGSSITPTGDVNVYGHVTDVTSGNVTNVDNLVGHRFTMGEGNSIGGTFGNMGFIDGRFQPGSGTTVTDFKGVYTAVDDNGNAGTITNLRGLDVNFTDGGAASFTTAAGVYITNVQATNAYGIYIASLTGGTIENSIFVADGAGDGVFLDDLLVGASTETISDTGLITNFSTGGDDLFVAGQIGSEGVIFSDTGMEVQANTTSRIGAFFNDGNADTRQGIFVQACLDTNPTSSCNLVELRDGNGTVIGAIEGNGAGGVTNASSGSDYAELFPGILAAFSAGDILALDADGNIQLASDANDIIGAFSTSPNVLGNWFEGWESAGNYVPVALLGQVPVQVNDEGGAIAAGDYLTLSSVPGVAKKATGVGFMLGRALESHASGNGTIQVFIEPTWQALDVVINENGTTTIRDDMRLVSAQRATADNSLVNSPSLMLRGSAWNEGENISTNVEMKLVTSVTNTEDYHLSIQNTADTEVAYINNAGTMHIAGDMIITGHLYPSDKGVAQTEKYIYYDGDSGPGGDFMRTNSSGWATGSYDFAEMFPSSETLEPGDVVIFGSSNETVIRSSISYDKKIAGIVSTRPGFLAGENKEGHYPIALSGRVPTKVSLENGAIDIGDPLTSSSKQGYAMKATEQGSIVGYALEPYEGGVDDKIVVFVNAGYYGQEKKETPQAVSAMVGSSTLSSLDLNGTLYMHANRIVDLAGIEGFADNWSIAEDGTISTKSLLKTVVESYQGEDVETIAVTSREVLITLSGTVELENGQAIVVFEDLDPSFNDIISTVAPLRVFVTPNAPISLYVSEKNQNGFAIQEINSRSSDVQVDWMVQAYRKDYEPKKYLEIQKEDVAAPLVGTSDEDVTESIMDANDENENEIDASVREADLPPVPDEDGEMDVAAPFMGADENETETAESTDSATQVSPGDEIENPSSELSVD